MDDRAIEIVRNCLGKPLLGRTLLEMSRKLSIFITDEFKISYTTFNNAVPYSERVLTSITLIDAVTDKVILHQVR